MANLFFIILFQPFKFANHKLKYNMGAVLFKLLLGTFGENRTSGESWEKLLEKEDSKRGANFISFTLKQTEVKRRCVPKIILGFVFILFLQGFHVFR